MDSCGLLCCIFCASPFLLGLALWLDRWCHTHQITRCPRCKMQPPVMDTCNVCLSCGCGYDKWGNLWIEENPVLLRNLDLSYFKPRRSVLRAGCERVCRRELSQDIKP